jgi:hypothetical protein
MHSNFVWLTNKADSDPSLVETKAASFINIQMEDDEEPNDEFIGTPDTRRGK